MKNENQNVELHPELKAYLNPNEKLGLVLQHPLVYSVPYFESTNSFLNEYLTRKKEALADAIAEKDWESAIWIHERPWRINALIEYIDKTSEKEYWQLVARVWQDSEGPGINKGAWRTLFSGYI